jgi:predicted peptidase
MLWPQQMPLLRKSILTLAAVFVFMSPARAQRPIDGFLPRTFTNSNGAKMPYRLFIPPTYDAIHSYPLIVYLHGGAGNGTDNVSQISGGNTEGTHVWTTKEAQREHAAFVLAPQAPNNEDWGGPENSDLSPAAESTLEIIESLEHEFKIDKARLYITGQSFGGYGTWDIIIRRPNLFAAAIPICGSGVIDNSPFKRPYSAAEFERIKDLPIWVFQGADDKTVPAEGPRKTVATLQSLGSKVKYTEYVDVGHQVWPHAYHEPKLINWLFAQHKSD